MSINFKKKHATILTSLLMYAVLSLSGCATEPSPSTTLINATEITLEGSDLSNGSIFETKSYLALQLNHE